MVVALASGPARAETKTTRFLQADSSTQVTVVPAVPTGGTFDTNQAGFTGTAFFNGAANATAYVEWQNIKIQSGGNKKLTLRYAYTGATRSIAVTVNGVAPTGGCAATISPAAGASFTDWKTHSCNVDLVAGGNIIRMRGTTASGLPNIDRLDVSETSETTPDWGIVVVESQMLRVPNSRLKSDGTQAAWGYAYALFLHGIYLTYLRTQDPRYLAYVKNWIDGVVGSQGNIYADSTKTSVRSLDALDYWFPGTALLDVYNQNPNGNYRIALQTIRNRYTEMSNTSGGQPTWSSLYFSGGGTNADGGFQHRSSTPNQLWLDGVFMSSKYLRGYGDRFLGGDKTVADNTNALQLLATFKHLKDSELCQDDTTCGNGGVCVKLGADAWGKCSADDTSSTTGLLWHAYDKDGDPAAFFVNAGENSSNYGAAYANAEHTQEYWCRAMGWFSVASVDVLETMSTLHPERNDLIAVVQGLADSLASYQDTSGRWFQLVNKQSNPSNWTETSCSAMYSYMMKKGRNLGFITNSAIDANANNGYSGVLAKISFAPDSARAADLSNLVDTSDGTNLGDETYYFQRPRITNDNHGLGAFLMMYEYFTGAGAPPPPVCGNLMCEPGETTASCPGDCPPTGNVTLNPQADAHVRDGSSAGTNFGGGTALEVKFSTVAGNNRNAFLRFSLSGVGSTVTSAKVRLFGNSVTTPKALAIYSVADVVWGETSINWNNQPLPGAKQGNSVTVPITAGWNEFDVTGYLQAQKNIGAVAVSFELKQDGANNDAPTSLSSKEGSNKPELVVQSQ
jgi:unsaturated rhamnogalacturonyl hydrolase